MKIIDFVYAYEVKYRAWGADAPSTEYYSNKPNATSAKARIENEGMLVDDIRKVKISVSGVRNARPDAIKDASDALLDLIWCT